MSDAQVDEQRACFRDWLTQRAPGVETTIVETHVSILAFGEDRVWKLKKAVRFPFVDLTAPDLRRANAEREVRVNRRFAPDVYLGVLDLQDRNGEIVDTVVEMRRMPDALRLSSLVRTSEAAACVDRIVEAIARIHRDAPRSADIDRAGLAATLACLWSTNLDELGAYAGTVLDPALLDRVATDARQYIDGRATLFDERITDGRIRDGHGDLLADDVFCLDDGPTFLDCLEFDDALRYGDVIADVGFLGMDLECLGRRDLADALLEGYRRATGDDCPASLADLYIAYRAVVRSKVACLSIDTDQVAGGTARRLLALAAEHLVHGRVRLVLVGGPPATGKTTFSRELQRVTGWRAVHSDEVRKHLAGLDPTDSAASALDHGLYTADWTAGCYTALLEAARGPLEHGETVILDASWSDARWRAAAEQLARETWSELTCFMLTAPPEVVDARAADRASAHGDASDAGPAVAAALRSRFEHWPLALVLDATETTEHLARQAQERLFEPI